MRAYISIVGYWICVPIEECGERQLYLATSARYPPASASSDRSSGVPLGHGVEVAVGTTGEIGSGVYSVLWDGTRRLPPYGSYWLVIEITEWWKILRGIRTLNSIVSLSSSNADPVNLLSAA